MLSEQAWPGMAYKNVDRRLGGGAQRPNREIVSFRSCVRARGDCQVEMSLKRDPRRLSLFPFGLGRLSLFPWDPPPPPKLLSSFSWLYRYTPDQRKLVLGTNVKIGPFIGRNILPWHLC